VRPPGFDINAKSNSPSRTNIILITTDPIDVASVMGRVRRSTSGALACFVGVVRDHHEGHSVHHLVYQAYPPMAEREMARIAQEARQRWPLDGVALIHRTGRLEIGEASVAVVVASPHRKEAFEACSHIIEELKRSVPIWKKEFGEAGESWVIGPV
jgi:molybdopterin synthase catalytic subunit